MNAGVQLAAAPAAPTIPANAVVVLWFSFNGGVLQLLSVNGLAATLLQYLKPAMSQANLVGVMQNLDSTLGPQQVY